MHADLTGKTEKAAVELRAVPKDLKPRELTHVGKFKKYFIVVKCINLMCNSNQIRLWAVCPVIHKEVSRVGKIVRFSWDTALDLVISCCV